MRPKKKYKGLIQHNKRKINKRKRPGLIIMIILTAQVLNSVSITETLDAEDVMDLEEDDETKKKESDEDADEEKKR